MAKNVVVSEEPVIVTVLAHVTLVSMEMLVSVIPVKEILSVLTTETANVMELVLVFLDSNIQIQRFQSAIAQLLVPTIAVAMVFATVEFVIVILTGSCFLIALVEFVRPLAIPTLKSVDVMENALANLVSLVLIV